MGKKKECRDGQEERLIAALLEKNSWGTQSSCPRRMCVREAQNEGAQREKSAESKCAKRAFASLCGNWGRSELQVDLADLLCPGAERVSADMGEDEDRRILQGSLP